VGPKHGVREGADPSTAREGDSMRPWPNYFGCLFHSMLIGNLQRNAATASVCDCFRSFTANRVHISDLMFRSLCRLGGFLMERRGRFAIKVLLALSLSLPCTVGEKQQIQEYRLGRI